jgi:hypothetical protein
MVNIIDEESRVVDPDNLDHQISEYLKLKSSIEFMETRQRELREKLFGAIEQLGFEDDKGNIQLELDQEIGGIVRLEKQRRVSRKIDEGVAETLIAELGLEDELYKTIRVVDEDALMAAVYQGKITDDQLDEMYPPKIVWALMTKKS